MLYTKEFLGLPCSDISKYWNLAKKPMNSDFETAIIMIKILENYGFHRTDCFTFRDGSEKEIIIGVLTMVSFNGINLMEKTFDAIRFLDMNKDSTIADIEKILSIMMIIKIKAKNAIIKVISNIKTIMTIEIILKKKNIEVNTYKMIRILNIKKNVAMIEAVNLILKTKLSVTQIDEILKGNINNRINDIFSLEIESIIKLAQTFVYN